MFVIFCVPLRRVLILFVTNSPQKLRQTAKTGDPKSIRLLRFFEVEGGK